MKIEIICSLRLYQQATWGSTRQRPTATEDLDDDDDDGQLRISVSTFLFRLQIVN